MTSAEVIFDVAPGRFDEQVVQASFKRAVVVDFWAEWCAPCRALTPVLERVVGSFKGRAVLAKVNIEQDREVAVRYGIQSIPNVKVFREGKVVGQFMGALPEPQVARILEAVIPSRADELTAEGDHLLQESKPDEAEKRYQKALQDNPQHSGALVRLGTLALEAGDLDRAQEMLSRIEENAADYDAAQGLLARIEFSRTCQQKGGRAACEQRLAEDDGDLDARYDLACCLAAEGEYGPALEQFLEIFSVDKNYRDQAPKDAMVRIFSLVGPRSELADTYRRKLAAVLY
ncbi:MAG: tetratricopeptide repeat protein [Candidatus Brocadiae bacterium]|nr:tetratricopeptide repeat protein [Candidatus Brocadiia bacterium]